MIDKYRVWDNYEKEYLKEPVYVGEKGIIIDVDKELTDCADADRLEADLCSPIIDNMNKEIYENDIVKYSYTSHTGHYYSYYRLIKRQIDGGFRMSGKQIDSNSRMIIHGAFNSNVVVVGNIREHYYMLENPDYVLNPLID